MKYYQQLLLEREDIIRSLHRFEFGQSENRQDQINRLREYRRDLKKLVILCEQIYNLNDEDYEIQGGVLNYQGSPVIFQRKSEVKKLLDDNNIQLAHYWNYAKISAEGDYYWINPLATAVNNDWSIVLNDVLKRKVMVLFIPSGSFSVGERYRGFIRRTDKQHYLDLKISADTFVDNISKNDLSSYIIKSLDY